MIVIFSNSSFFKPLFRFSFKVGIISWSSSMDVMLQASRANSAVKIPNPGPISITVSRELISAALTIFFTMSFDVRKFWPRYFLGLICMNDCNFDDCFFSVELSINSYQLYSLRFS